MNQFMTMVSLGCNKLARSLVRISGHVCSVLAVFMTIVTLVQVLCRFVIHLPFQGSEELARFTMCWLAMLGSAIALREGRHLGVRVLVEKLPAGFYDRWLVPFIQLIILGFLLILTAQGWNMAWDSADLESPAMEISMLWPYLCLPIGGGLMSLVVLADVLQDWFPTEAGSTANIAAAVMEDIDELVDDAKDFGITVPVESKGEPHQ